MALPHFNNLYAKRKEYDGANQRDPWTYDAAGNLLSDGTTTYTYDALGRVTTRATGGITTTNTYNGDGVLLRQQTGATITAYTQDLASPLDQILSDGTSTYIYGAERLLAQQGTTSTWYDADALGSVRQTLDGNGTPTSSPIWYDPWATCRAARRRPSASPARCSRAAPTTLHSDRALTSSTNRDLCSKNTRNRLLRSRARMLGMGHNVDNKVALIVYT